MEDGIIYTFGDVDAFVVIFDGLRLLFDPATTTFFSGTGGLGLGVATTLAAMIALIGTMSQYANEQRLQIQGPLMGLFIYALVAIPTVDRMFISDVNTGKTLPVYDVPIGLGVVGFGMSLISYRVSELMETAFQSVAIEGTAFESTLTGGSGFLSPVKTLYALRNSSLPELDEHLIYNIFSYTKFCLVRAATEDVDAGLPDVNFSAVKMRNEVDPFDYMMTEEFIQPNHENKFAEYMDPTTSQETLETCQSIRLILNGDEDQPGSLNNYLTYSTRFGASRLRSIVSGTANPTQVCADGGVCQSSVSAITTSYEMAAQVLGGVGQARDFFALRVMRDFNDIAVNARDIDPNSAIMAVSNINEAILTTQLQESLEAETFVNFMMPAMNFIIMLFYALFPLAMLIMITKGMGASQYLGGYLLIGIWGYSIIPVATAINYITIANTREALSALINMEGFSSYGYEMMVNSAANYLSVGSNMLAAAPIVTLAVISGSVYALTSVASSAAAPAGGASGAAARSSVQSHGQISNLSLTAPHTDVAGSTNVAPVSAHAKQLAGNFTYDQAFNNANAAKGSQLSVDSAKESLNKSLLRNVEQTGSSIQRVTAGGGSSAEVTTVSGLQKVGSDIISTHNISTDGFSQEQLYGFEAATGNLASVAVSAQASGGISSKLIQKAIEKSTGIQLSDERAQGMADALNNTQNPSANPGTSDNPTSSKGKANRAEIGLPGFLSASVGIDGGFSAYDGNRQTDTTTKGTNHNGATSTETGGGEQINEENGVSTGNSGSINLTREEAEAITRNNADVSSSGVAYTNALEKQQRFEESAESSRSISQNKGFDLEDAYVQNKFSNPSSVYDWVDNTITSGVENNGLGLSQNQINGIVGDFNLMAQETSQLKMPGSTDGLAATVGVAHTSDEASYKYQQIAANPSSPLNDQNLTREQALGVAEVLGGLDSKLFEPLIGSQGTADIKNINDEISSKKGIQEEAHRASERAESKTENIDAANLGPGGEKTSLGRINSTLDDISAKGGAGVMFAENLKPLFNEANLQQVIDDNSDALGVEKGTRFSDPSMSQQQRNMVLAEQMKSAVDIAGKAAGLNPEDVEGAKFDGNSGISQGNNMENMSAINAGNAALRYMSSNMQDSAYGQKAGLQADQSHIRDQNILHSDEINPNLGYNMSGDFLKGMFNSIPKPDNEFPTLSSNNLFDSANSDAPLLQQQESWNQSLNSALNRELSMGTIDNVQKDRLYNEHSIDPEQTPTKTPLEAYGGLYSSSVVGTYADRTPSEETMRSVNNLFSDQPERKSSGSTLDRLTNPIGDSPSPLQVIGSQIDTMDLNNSETREYVSMVRDQLSSLTGADLSKFDSDFINSQYSLSVNPTNTTPNTFTMPESVKSTDAATRPEVTRDLIESMVNSLPSDISGGKVIRALEQPLLDIDAQRDKT